MRGEITGLPLERWNWMLNVFTNEEGRNGKKESERDRRTEEWEEVVASGEPVRSQRTG